MTINGCSTFCIINFSNFTFSSIIDLKKNLGYLKYSIIPLILIIGIGILVPQFFGESTHRIVNYNTEFKNQLFKINLEEQNQLVGYKNEDFIIHFDVTGSALPEYLFIIKNGIRHKVLLDDQHKGSFTFEKINTGFKKQY